MPPITHLNWDELESELAPPRGRVWGIWPSPVDHDACFQAMGFTEFADPDDEYDADLTAIVGRLLSELGALGEARHVGRTATKPILAAVMTAAHDDRDQVRVHFGSPPRAILEPHNGHALFWVWLAKGDFTGRIAACAGDRQVRRLRLDWARGMGGFDLTQPVYPRWKRWLGKPWLIIILVIGLMECLRQCSRN